MWMLAIQIKAQTLYLRRIRNVLGCEKGSCWSNYPMCQIKQLDRD